MTEREKMLAGQLYLASDPELAAARRRARALTRQYNDTAEEDEAERFRLLQELLGSVGAGTFIELPFRCDYGTYITVGERFYANFGCVILDCAPVRIGDDVMFGPSVHVYAAGHPVEAATRIAGPEYSAPVTVGDRVWIGGGSILCPGVTIGENTTIGAGSVVTRDIPANVVAVGNPCRVLRTLPQ